ncbi:vascular cell adhesion protein 1-like [Halichoeres trimaculatus]|uniref:vascular cell adhesion protein 1-like n=1 Tax=Halichoeres trimaculatus TaxID=147232 RepID=UPI003D9F0884
MRGIEFAGVEIWLTVIPSLSGEPPLLPMKDRRRCSGRPRHMVRGQTDWGVTYSSHQICAFKGSTVDIPCTFTYPLRIDELDTKVEETLWFTKLNGDQHVDLRSDPDYSGRVEYLFKQNDCTLRIKDLRETDSAEYKFRFITNQREGGVTGSPGVTLTFTGLRVVVVSVWTEADLRCESSCNLSDNPSYVWYKDGEKMDEQTSSLRVSDFDAPTFCSVSVNPLGEIRENSRVTLTCSSDGYPTPEYTWYKWNQHGYFRKGSKLVFRSIKSSDSGEYYCSAKGDLGRERTSGLTSIDVKYAPKPPSVSVSPSGEIVEGSSVTLTCSSDANPAANYTWFKKDEDSPKASGEIFTIENTGAEHSGDYVCVAQNEKGHHNSTVHVTVVGGKFNTLG